MLVFLAAFITRSNVARADEDYEAQRFSFAAQPGCNGYTLRAGDIGNFLRARRLWDEGERHEDTELLDDWVMIYRLSIVVDRMLGEFDARLSIE